MKRLLVGFSVLVLTTLFATLLHATDEIRIIRGSLVQPLDLTGELNVEGTSGVSIDAALNSVFATPSWGFCDLHPCLPGEVVSLHVSYGVSFPPFTGSGQLTMRGQTYSMFDEASATLQFDGEFVLPEFTDTRTAELSAPFTFSGSLTVPNRHEPGTFDVFELHGSGVATVRLVPHQFITGWVVASVTYDFVPDENVIPR